MAGAQIEIAQNRFEKGDKGMLALSLTEYDTGLECEIAAGSVVEIAGAIFEFTSDEAITGWGGIGISNDVYVKCVVAGTAVTAEFTTIAPTWNADKAGWYGTAGSALHRYVAKLYKDGAGAYTKKRMLSEVARQQIVTLAEQVAASVVDTTQLADKAVQSAKVDDSSVYSVHVISTSDEWLIPAGLYIMAITQASGVNTYLELWTGSSWVPSAQRQVFGGGMLLSDGASIRLANADVSDDATVYFLKFT